MPPDPPNSLIYSVFLALVAAGPLQCERLEPPVMMYIALSSIPSIVSCALITCDRGLHHSYHLIKTIASVQMHHKPSWVAKEWGSSLHGAIDFSAHYRCPSQTRC